MLVTVGVVALTGGIVLGAVSTMATLSAKNVSLNDSGINLRRSVLNLTTDAEKAVEVTDVANFDPVTNTFTPVAKGTWGNAVRMMTLLPGSFYLVDSSTSLYTASNPPSASGSSTPTYLSAGTTTVNATYDATSSAITTLNSLLTGSERLLALYPIRRQSDSASGKLGLALSAKPSITASGKVAFSLASPLTAAPASSTSDANATIQTFNQAYLIRECAYVVLPNGDGNACNLYYMSNTAVPGALVLRSPAIAARQPTDIYHPAASAAGTGACFCLTTDSSGEQVLQILLPVASRDYSNVLLNGGRTAAAYNLYITANVARRSLQGLNTQ